MLVRVISGKIEEGQTVVPVEIVKQGVSKFPVAKQEAGKLVPAWVHFSQAAVEKLKTKLENKKTLKVYNGHVSPEELQGKMHRPLTDWIATLQGPYEVKQDEKGKDVLVGMLKVHSDTPVGGILMNRIKEVPEEVKFSLDYRADLTPAEIDGRRVFDVRDIGRVRSLDFVPESGFDNGVHLPSLMQSMATALDKFNKKEDKAMTVEELKEKHPELYQAIVDGVKKELEPEGNGKGDKEVNQSMSDFTESEEYKELMQSVADLKTGFEALKEENEQLKQSKAETEKELTILQERARQAEADKVMDEILSSSMLPETLHPKVKSMVDWRKFVGDDGFEPGTEGYDKFKEAFQSEVKDWEEKLPPSPVNIGLSDDKSTVHMGEVERLRARFDEAVKNA